jgi:hypothetical protein
LLLALIPHPLSTGCQEETLRFSLKEEIMASARFKNWFGPAGLGSVVVLVLGVVPAHAQLLRHHSSPPCADEVPLYEGKPIAPDGTTRPDGTMSPDGTGRPTGTETPPALEGFRPPAGPGEMVSVQDSRGGYIDSAIVGNELRLRYESAYDNNRPDRAEFFYAKCGCFRTAGLGAANVGFDPKAAGPRLPETKVDYQDITAYGEVALAERFSVFVETPFRFLNPEQNANTAGFADMNAGLKYALLQNADQVGTFQLRTYIPTGASTHGLGTDHVSVEPALLYYQRLSDRLTLEAELRDWIAIGGSDFAGNVLRYGAGVSYAIHRSHDLTIAPVFELVGWTVLDGKEFLFPENVIKDASGDTIVNGKIGVRVNFGASSSLYAGYGRALTGDVWYKDIIRVEYRLAF